MTSDLEEPEGSVLVLDTSALINILGCGHADRLLRCFHRPCIVEERVLTELTYHPIPLRDAQREVDDLRRDALLTVSRMSDEDYELYLQLAGVSGSPGLGVGESAAIALAANSNPRQAVVVLDDRKARRRAAAQFPELRVMSSLRLFLEAAHIGNFTMSDTRALFTAASNNASMCILKEERALIAPLELNDI